MDIFYTHQMSSDNAESTRHNYGVLANVTPSCLKSFRVAVRRKDITNLQPIPQGPIVRSIDDPKAITALVHFKKGNTPIRLKSIFDREGVQVNQEPDQKEKTCRSRSGTPCSVHHSKRKSRSLSVSKERNSNKNVQKYRDKRYDEDFTRRRSSDRDSSPRRHSSRDKSVRPFRHRSNDRFRSLSSERAEKDLHRKYFSRHRSRSRASDRPRSRSLSRYSYRRDSRERHNSYEKDKNKSSRRRSVSRPPSRRRSVSRPPSRQRSSDRYSTKKLNANKESSGRGDNYRRSSSSRQKSPDRRHKSRDRRSSRKRSTDRHTSRQESVNRRSSKQRSLDRRPARDKTPKRYHSPRSREVDHSKSTERYKSPRRSYSRERHSYYKGRKRSITPLKPGEYRPNHPDLKRKMLEREERNKMIKRPRLSDSVEREARKSRSRSRHLSKSPARYQRRRSPSEISPRGTRDFDRSRRRRRSRSRSPHSTEIPQWDPNIDYSYYEGIPGAEYWLHPGIRPGFPVPRFYPPGFYARGIPPVGPVIYPPRFPFIPPVIRPRLPVYNNRPKPKITPVTEDTPATEGNKESGNDDTSKNESSSSIPPAHLESDTVLGNKKATSSEETVTSKNNEIQETNIDK